MFDTIVKALKIKEIRIKILLTLLFILIYRIGCFIPVPGIGEKLIDGSELQKLSYLNIMSMMTGGSLAQGTWFAMGIGPYINASIIIQLMTVVSPRLERYSHMGEAGQKKIAFITRITAVILAIIQSIGILVSYYPAIIATCQANGTAHLSQYFGGANWPCYLIAVIVYASGSLATIWIGERITDYGVSNGISLLIFIGVLSTAGTSFIAMIKNIGTDGGSANAFWDLVIYVLAIVVIFACIVFVDLAERKVPVQYAKRVQGRKMYGGQSTIIPIKINATGVMPLIFAFSFLSFPELLFTIINSLVNNPNAWIHHALLWWQQYMGTASIMYMIVLCLLIFGFSFFYASMQFKPDDISKSIQQNGGYIIGVRPGKPTTEYLKRIHRRITLFGAIFLAFMALIPTIVFRLIDPSSSSIFSATGLLICVSIALEFNNALESQIMMKQYKGFLK